MGTESPLTEPATEPAPITPSAEATKVASTLIKTFPNSLIYFPDFLLVEPELEPPDLEPELTAAAAAP